MSDDTDRPEPSATDADVADVETTSDDALADGGLEQGEPNREPVDDTGAARNPAAVIDPDSPGLSALGLQDGDPVEPSEPA